MSIRYNPKETILLLYNSNIKGVSRKEVIELKSSFIVLTRGSLGFTIVKYLDLDCLLYISNIYL